MPATPPDDPGAAPPPVTYNFAGDLLARSAVHGARRAYVDDRGSLTYAGLGERVRCFAAGLAAAGVRPEERLFLLAHDTLDWPVAFLGALHAGVVPVAVNTLLTVDDYAYLLGHSRPRAAVVSQALLPVFRQALAQSGRIVETLVVSRTDGAPDDAETFAAFCGRAQAASRPTATLADDAAFWLYSSGSTGRPKAAVHTHASLHWTNALYGRQVLALEPQDVVFSAAKLFFAYGLGNALTFPLCAGATTILMAERPTPAAVFERLAAHAVTVFFGVPTLYAALLAAAGLPARDALALRRCVSAGEALPREVGARFAAHFGCDVLDGIGSTEMLHIFLSNRPGRVRYGTTGIPVPGYAVELRREDGAPVQDGQIGDLYIRGPSAALLYWADRAQSRATFQGEWTRSGDKYVREPDGCYVYSGRGDDMLKVSGQYVSPFEVEGALMGHPAVLEAAVIGRIDAQGLTRTKAYVVLKPGHVGHCALEGELKGFVKDRLAPFKYPRDIEFVDELPKTATGKIQRFRLREREAARHS